MTAFDDPITPDDEENTDVVRNPGGEAADEEADFHGDRMADADAVEEDAERL
jgi:hypothetical protein